MMLKKADHPKLLMVLKGTLSKPSLLDADR